MSKLNFHPWIGTHYGKSELGKLLIIGDSHYWPYNNAPITYHPDFTKNIIQDRASLNAIFFKNIAQLFHKNNFEELRDDIAFANAIQEFMPTATAIPIYATKKRCSIFYSRIHPSHRCR